MTYRLVVRPEVESDLRQAESWYESHRTGLGTEFVNATLASIDRLRLNPLMFAIRHRRKKIGYAYIRRFPYRIIFRVLEDTVIIYGVLHSSRHERHWKARL